MSSLHLVEPEILDIGHLQRWNCIVRPARYVPHQFGPDANVPQDPNLFGFKTNWKGFGFTNKDPKLQWLLLLNIKEGWYLRIICMNCMFIPIDEFIWCFNYMQTELMGQKCQQKRNTMILLGTGRQRLWLFSRCILTTPHTCNDWCLEKSFNLTCFGKIIFSDLMENCQFYQFLIFYHFFPSPLMSASSSWNSSLTLFTSSDRYLVGQNNSWSKMRFHLQWSF